MKIAIHINNEGFSQRWINYCENNNIPYKIVNCYSNEIIQQLSDCDALLWSHNHNNYKDVLYAKQLLFSLEQSGKIVFPDFRTGWHFNDKVGQKYLLEQIGAPLVPSYVFYTKKEAMEWIKKNSFPKVFKLRGGAGSSNVRLVRSKKAAVRLTNKAFGRGFSQFDRIGYLKERMRKVAEGKDNLIGIFKGLARLIIPTEFAKFHGREKGYIFFQDFIPDNTFDIRVIVTGDKAFAIKRMTRKNDFRASGSGNIFYDRSAMDIRCVKIAFDVNKKLKSQSVAYDFVFKEKEPLIVEISYGYVSTVYDACPGFWDSELNWHEEKFIPQNWIIENVIATIKEPVCV